VDLLVNVIEVIRVIGGITITRVIRVGLPIRDGLVRLASWRFGRSDAVALEVAPTEDAHGELLAGGISAGGIAREGSKEPSLGIEEGKVDRDIGVIDSGSHRDVAHGGTRVAAMEVSETLGIIRVQAGHDESRGNEEVAAEAFKVGPDCSDAEGASTAGGGHTSREHRREEVIGKAKKGTAAAKDAVIPDALALECIIALSELRVDVVDAVKL
jgi:hypothetical protein